MFNKKKDKPIFYKKKDCKEFIALGLIALLWVIWYAIL